MGAPAGLSEALDGLAAVAEQARAAPNSDEALLSAVWLHGYLSTLAPDGLATAERHAERVERARELLPLLALARAWQTDNTDCEGRRCLTT